jgi:predicted phosphodiesterase
MKPVKRTAHIFFRIPPIAPLIGILILLSACQQEADKNTEAGLRYAQTVAADENASHFILLGDVQRTSMFERLACREQNDVQRARIMQRIVQEDPAFLVLLGDLVFQASSEAHWEKFDLLMQDVRAQSIPIFPILGNHEYFGNPQKGREHINARFPLLREKEWYTKRFGRVALVFLNGNTAKMNAAAITEQALWYDRQLVAYDKDATISQVFVCCHQPPFTNSSLDAEDEYRQMFSVPFQEAEKTAVFFSGHCHAYEHFYRQGKHFIVSGGGGGPRRKLDVSAERKYDDSYDGSGIRPFHYMRVQLEGDSVHISMQQLDETTGSWSAGDEIALYP